MKTDNNDEFDTKYASTMCSKYIWYLANNNKVVMMIIIVIIVMMMMMMMIIVTIMVIGMMINSLSLYSK